MPATPGSQLQKKYQSEIRNQGYKIKVVEKTGTTLKKVQQKSSPFKQQRCGRENCLVCKQAGRGPRNAHGVTYEIECQECESKYVGETARNAYTRGTEHAGGLENRDEKSALWRHCVEKHGKERQKFKMSVTGVWYVQAYDQTIFKGQTECNLNTLTPYIYAFLWKYLYT